MWPLIDRTISLVTDFIHRAGIWALAGWPGGLQAVMFRRFCGAIIIWSFCGTLQAGTVESGLGDFRQGRFSEAFQAWQEAGQAGDARGALYIGVLYDSGLGVAQNYAKAMAWYRRASALGSAAGAFNVGVMYDSGLGVRKSARDAATWYARAARQGFGRAEYNLALLYEAGSGVPRNRARAVALYKLAARHGITAARAQLAVLHERAPTAVPEQPDDAMQGFKEAQQLLLNRGAAESARMVTLFRHAADQRNPLAEYDLGYCYDAGIGVPRDPAKAYEWYQRAVGDAQDGSLRALAQAGVDNLRQARK
jgi:TPR repeat protein